MRKLKDCLVLALHCGVLCGGIASRASERSTFPAFEACAYNAGPLGGFACALGFGTYYFGGYMEERGYRQDRIVSDLCNGTNKCIETAYQRAVPRTPDSFHNRFFSIEGTFIGPIQTENSKATGYLWNPTSLYIKSQNQSLEGVLGFHYDTQQQVLVVYRLTSQAVPFKISFLGQSFSSVVLTGDKNLPLKTEGLRIDFNTNNRQRLVPPILGATVGVKDLQLDPFNNNSVFLLETIKFPLDFVGYSNPTIENFSTRAGSYANVVCNGTSNALYLQEGWSHPDSVHATYQGTTIKFMAKGLQSLKCGSKKYTLADTKVYCDFKGSVKSIKVKGFLGRTQLLNF